MDYIYYTFLAGWCGDAIGAQIEFMNRKFTKNEIDDVMNLTGINSNGIPMGLVTDDSEMEMCLLNALIQGKDDEYFPSHHIAQNYIEWYKSEPFDVGQTTTFALLGAENEEDLIFNAIENNMSSESNGSLMRCIPIAIFGINKNDETIMIMAEDDAKLTHSNEVVGTITGIYCIVISKILRNKIKKINNNIDDLFETIYETIENILSIQTFKKILEWLNIGLGLNDLSKYDSIKNEGHVKHAFVFFIYFLKNINEYTYEKAISELLMCGGDTDTNAKIIGNLFGAYYGNCVPEKIVNAVMNFDCNEVENPFFQRPQKYSVNNAKLMIYNIPETIFT
jgi:ADP-ribosyl-[dinitrogen reductase] hydrolase